MILFFMNMMLILNFIFITLTHPMSMGFIIMAQLMIAITIMNFYLQLPWFSYMMFLMFIGGMFILFTYMCSISSNNIIMISPKLIISLNLMILINFLWSMYMKSNISLVEKWINISNLNLISNNNMYLMKMFNNFSSNLTFFMIIYLFILLIMVNKITNVNMGPLRKNTN